MKEVDEMLKIKLLHANQGDCIIITYGDKNIPHYIIIDSGIGKTCTRELKLILRESSEEWTGSGFNYINAL